MIHKFWSDRCFRRLPINDNINWLEELVLIRFSFFLLLQDQIAEAFLWCTLTCNVCLHFRISISLALPHLHGVPWWTNGDQVENVHSGLKQDPWSYTSCSKERGLDGKGGEVVVTNCKMQARKTKGEKYNKSMLCLTCRPWILLPGTSYNDFLKLSL